MINSSNIKSNLGSVLKELRNRKGITQEKLAECIGMQPYAITKIETGRAFISSETLSKLCNFFNVEPYIFFLNKDQAYTVEDLDKLSKINNKLDRIYEIIVNKN